MGVCFDNGQMYSIFWLKIEFSFDNGLIITMYGHSIFLLKIEFSQHNSLHAEHGSILSQNWDTIFYFLPIHFTRLS